MGKDRYLSFKKLRPSAVQSGREHKWFCYVIAWVTHKIHRDPKHSLYHEHGNLFRSAEWSVMHLHVIYGEVDSGVVRALVSDIGYTLVCSSGVA